MCKGLSKDLLLKCCRYFFKERLESCIYFKLNECVGGGGNRTLGRGVRESPYSLP